MTKLVQYVGGAQRRVVTEAEFTAAGFTGIGNMVFAEDQPTDFYRSVSDGVAVFLLSQGDFVAEDGSTIVDIFQNSPTIGATPEVLSVQPGEDGDPQTGIVIVPAFGDEGVGNDTLALRQLGRAAGKALAGDDDLVADALTKTMFTDDTSVLLYKKEDETIGALVVPINTIVGRKATGEITAWTIADLQAALDAGTGFSLDSLSNVVTAGAIAGAVLGTLDGENWQPVVVGDISALPSRVTTDSLLVEITDAWPISLDLSALGTDVLSVARLISTTTVGVDPGDLHIDVTLPEVMRDPLSLVLAGDGAFQVNVLPGDLALDAPLNSDESSGVLEAVLATQHYPEGVVWACVGLGPISVNRVPDSIKLRSPDGTVWTGTIDNSGVLSWA